MKRKSASFIPLVAIGGSLATGPATALELGDLTVESHLGQPLRASIAYALAPNEQLSDLCVSISHGRAVDGVPGLGNATVSVRSGRILLTGDTPVTEPMLGARVAVNCPYTPRLVREYMLFIDPAGVASEAAAAPVAVSAPAVAAGPAAPQARRRAPSVDRRPIGQSTRYRVQPGDSLSEIVQRIENRGIGLWPAVNAIVDANPHAFIDNDPNRLKAGSWLDIPSFDGRAPVVAASAPATPAAGAGVYEPPVMEPVTREPAPAQSAAAPDADAATVSETAPPATPVDKGATQETAVTAVVPPVEEAQSEPNRAELRPGDVVIGAETVTPVTSEEIPTTIVRTGERGASTSLLVWLIGGALALLAGLLLFGRRLRDRFKSTPIGPAPAHQDRRDPQSADQPVVFEDIDYDIDDDSPTAENLALDANLFDGSGLAEGTDMDLAQDFGFAATTDLDIELPLEQQAEDGDGHTDVIPPMRADISSILESEVLPEDNDYDMSVIIDATKMPQPEEVTERDLQAVEVETGTVTQIADDYTISDETDFDILEQDYEDELTATQALNKEMIRAAEDLALRLEEDGDDEDTTSLPVDEAAASVDATAEFDVTAELPLAENDETLEMPRKSKSR